MIDDMEAGKIGIVLVKDMSRIGRNYCNYSAVVSVIGNIGISVVLALVMGMEALALARSSAAGLVLRRWSCSCSQIRAA